MRCYAIAWLIILTIVGCTPPKEEPAKHPTRIAKNGDREGPIANAPAPPKAKEPGEREVDLGNKAAIQREDQGKAFAVALQGLERKIGLIHADPQAKATSWLRQSQAEEQVQDALEKYHEDGSDEGIEKAIAARREATELGSKAEEAAARERLLLAERAMEAAQRAVKQAEEEKSPPESKSDEDKGNGFAGALEYEAQVEKLVGQMREALKGIQIKAAAEHTDQLEQERKIWHVLAEESKRTRESFEEAFGREGRKEQNRFVRVIKEFDKTGGKGFTEKQWETLGSQAPAGTTAWKAAEAHYYEIGATALAGTKMLGELQDTEKKAIRDETEAVNREAGALKGVKNEDDVKALVALETERKLCHAAVKKATKSRVDTLRKLGREGVFEDGGARERLGGEEKSKKEEEEHKREWDRVHAAEMERKAAENARWHTWTAADGARTIEAKFISVTGETVCLEKRDGTKLKIAKDNLSDGDLKWIARQGWKR